MDDPDGIIGPRPDLRQVICDALNQLHRELARLPLATDLEPQPLTIGCQRTWHDVQALNPTLDGGSFSACVARLSVAGDEYAYFVTALRSAARSAWQWAGSQGASVNPVIPDPVRALCSLATAMSALAVLASCPMAGRSAWS